MTRKKYILNFILDKDKDPIPVPFDVYIGGQDAREIPCTGWAGDESTTSTQDFTIDHNPNLYPQYYSDRYTINFDRPVGELKFSISGITIPYGAWEYELSDDKMSARFGYSNNSAMSNPDTGSYVMSGTVTITAYYMITTIEDCLNWLKTHKTA